LCLPFVALASPSPADACSRTPCWGTQFFPETSTAVPANLPAFVWQPSGEATATDPDQVALTGNGNGTPLPFTATPRGDGTYLIVPSPALDEGSYVLSDNNQCLGSAGPRSSFTLGPAAPLPAQLGMLVAAPPQHGNLGVATAKGSCNELVYAAYVDLQLVLAPDAEPWANALHYETLVDGKRYRAAADINQIIPLGSSWVGRGRDRVIARCDSATPDGTFSGVEPGMHEIVLRATIPGTQIVLASSSVLVDLSCAHNCDGVHGGDAGFGGHGHHDGHDGCSTAGGTPGVLGLALIALIGARRRRLCRR
jgi:MYXO-CTERM domain-containing protein